LRHEDDGTLINKDSESQQLSDYLQTYAKDPMTKKELKKHIATNAQLKDEEIKGKTKKIRRSGKDTNDVFWAIGKVHGIENIVYLTEEQIASVKSPAHLQSMINEVEPQPHKDLTREQRIQNIKRTTKDYKDFVDKMEISSTDKKKLLSLPFYLAKRRELPEPKRGQL
jgi:DNA repair ATPase RecN